MVELLQRYGLQLHPGFHKDADWAPFHVVEPIGEEIVSSRPLDGNPGLFREFADMKLKPSAIEDFVNTYGQLERQFGLDRLNVWFDQIRLMRKAVKSWEEANRRGDLNRWVAAFNNHTELVGSSLHIGRAGANIELRIIGGTLPPSLKIVPQTLNSAMWLQLAQRVSATTGLRRCQWCPRWFEYGLGTGRRKTGFYCSDRCRKAAYLHRKEKQK